MIWLNPCSLALFLPVIFFVKLTSHFPSSLASAARLHSFSGRLEKYERPPKRPRGCRTFPLTRPHARLRGRPTQIRLWAGALIKDAQRKDKKTLKVVQRGLKITLFSQTRTRHAHKARKSPAKSFHLIISSSVYNVPNQMLCFLSSCFSSFIRHLFAFAVLRVGAKETEKGQISACGSIWSVRGEIELKGEEWWDIKEMREKERWDIKEKMDSKCRRENRVIYNSKQQNKNINKIKTHVNVSHNGDSCGRTHKTE